MNFISDLLFQFKFKKDNSKMFIYFADKITYKNEEAFFDIRMDSGGIIFLYHNDN